MSEDTTWTESRALILAELKRMEVSINNLGSKIDGYKENGQAQRDQMRQDYEQRFSKLNVDFAVLQTKVAVGAALLSGAISVLVSWLMKGH